MVSCVDQVLGMTINGDEGDDITFAESGIPNPYLQVISISAVCQCVNSLYYLSVHLSLCVYICLSISVGLSIYLSLCSSIYVSICLSVCPSLYLSIYLSLCPSTYLFIFKECYPTILHFTWITDR